MQLHAESLPACVAVAAANAKENTHGLFSVMPVAGTSGISWCHVCMAPAGDLEMCGSSNTALILARQTCRLQHYKHNMLVAAPQTQVLLAAPAAAARPFSSCRQRQRYSTQRATRTSARQQSGGEPSDAGSRPAGLPAHRRLLSGVAAAGLAAALALTPASQSLAADAAKVLKQIGTLSRGSLARRVCQCSMSAARARPGRRRLPIAEPQLRRMPSTSVLNDAFILCQPNV